MTNPAVAQAGLFWTLPASAALTDYQYHCADLQTDGEVLYCDAANANSVGIILNKPAAVSQATELGSFGVFPVMGGESLNENDLLTTKSDGHAEAVDAAGEWIIGIAIGVGASGSIFSVLVGPFGDAHA